MVAVTDIYLEVGRRRVFACAVAWPGWCRSGRSEDAALAALTEAGPRYATVCSLAGLPFDTEAESADFAVVEKVPGSATTDFGALDVPPSLDSAPAGVGAAATLAAFVKAAWDAFDGAAAAAPAALRKGPRGGGRDRDAIVAHLAEADVLHARMLGLKHRPGRACDAQACALLRSDILAALAGNAVQEAAAGDGRRPLRFVARRIAWHALDHAWEIQDRQP
jgi:hypothetical protein